MEVRLPVGEVLHLEVLQRLAHRLDAAEQRGDHHRRAELVGHAAVLVRGRAWAGARGGRNAVTSWFIDAHGDVVGRDEREQEHERPGGPRVRARPARGRPASAADACRRARRPRRPRWGGAGPSGSSRVARRAAGSRSAARARPGPRPRGSSRRAGAGRRRPLRWRRGARQVDRDAAPPTASSRWLALGDPLDHVAVLVAGRERHPRVDARRVLAAAPPPSRSAARRTPPSPCGRSPRRLVMLLAIMTWVSATPLGGARRGLLGAAAPPRRSSAPAGRSGG